MDNLAPASKVVTWILSTLAGEAIAEFKASRNKDSRHVKRALRHAVRRGANRAVWETYGDDRRLRKRARTALLRGRRRHWPLLDRTALADLPHSVRARVRMYRPPAVANGRSASGDHPVIASWCEGILTEVEQEATRGEGTLAFLWLAFKRDHLDRMEPDREDRDSVSLPRSTGPTTIDRQVSVAPPFGKLGKRTQGREDMISGVLAGMQHPSVHVLAGGGGSGKTRVALEIAKRAERQGWEVWWVTANRINSSMREVANQIGVPAAQIDPAWSGRAHAPDLTWRFLNELSKPWLLVFDNADDPTLLDPSGGSVSDGTGWLRKPTGQHGAVLVTSRDRNKETWGDWSSVHIVSPLGSEWGAHMLKDLVNDAGSFEEARALAEELGGLPLALWAAANYLQSARSTRTWGGNNAAMDFDSYRQRVRDWASSPMGDGTRGSAESLGLRVVEGTLALSLELIEQRGPAQAATLLRALSCFANAPIPHQVVLDADLINQSPLFSPLGENGLGDMLDILLDFGLLDLHTSERPDPQLASVLSMHPVFQGILRSGSLVERERSEYCLLHIGLLQGALCDADPDQRQDWQLWFDLAPHCVEAVRNTLLGPAPVADSKLVSDAVELGRRTARWLIASGLLKPAEDLVVPLIEHCAKFGLGTGDREILGLRHERGRIMLERGDASAAEQELDQVIAERSRLLGENDPSTLASRHKYARAILEQTRWREAEPLLEEILRAENELQVRGPEHSDTMVVRHSLARAILHQGDRVGEAEVMLRDILEVMHRHWPPDNPQTLFVRQSLVTALRMGERWEDAFDEVKAALEVANRSAAKVASPESLMLRYQKGLVLLGLGCNDEAWEHLTDLYKEDLEVLGSAHVTTEMTFSLLARMRERFSDQ